MKVSEIIALVKQNTKGYGVIDDKTTRDQVLYGSTDKECTGIVTTIYASVDVIKKAHELGANFIISHEACWWNHGDHTDWLKDNKTFQMKKALLDEYDITVWRNHDYIHSGVLYHGEYVDGIFYGLSTELGWNDYVVGSKTQPMMFDIPETPTRELAQFLMEKMNLDGMKTLANIDGNSHRVMIPMHIIGQFDNDVLSTVETQDVDTLLAMEITDFTVGIYMRDSAMLSRQKAVLAAGHFNTEEPGMKWFANVYLKELLPEIQSTFVQAGDMYKMLLRKKH